MQGRDIVYILRRVKRRVLIIPEKRVVYVVSLPGYQDRCRPHKRIFTHDGLSAHVHNIVQEVEVHEWLHSGSERLYFAALF